MEIKKKNYKSLGAMMKAGDYEALLNDLQEMKTNGTLKDFLKTSTQNPISEFDDLLFFFPQYACKTIKNNEGKNEITSELFPKAMEFLEFALKNGANPNAYMKNGENCYLKACEIKTPQVLEYLINNDFNKIDLSHTDGKGNNGLFYATMAEATDVIDYLVTNCGFNINLKNFLSSDETCLHYACGHAKLKSFDKLIELGADPTVTDAYGCKACEMIMAGYDEETIEDFNMEDPEDIKELEMWKKFYEKALDVTQKYTSDHKVKHKTKF